MRILQLSSAQFLGGGERYLADLANALVDRGHEVFCILRHQSPLVPQLSKLRKENIAFYPLRNSFDAQSARRIASFVKKHQIDVVHAHMARDYPLAAFAAARSPKARFFVTRHVLFPMHRFHKLTLSGVSRVIAVSNAVSVQLRSEHIVAPERIAVVHNGVDCKRLDQTVSSFYREQFLQHWNLPQNCLLVGTVGELKALKGQEEFLRAAADVAQHFPLAHFVIAGVDSSPAQEQRALLQNLASELGLRDRVIFIDWMDEIATLYRALDVFVSASRAESFGLAMAEAMACETAVVATQTEGAKEIINDGKTGLLVPIGSTEAIAGSVTQLLQNSAQRAALGKCAAEDVRNRFSLERMVTATEDLYRASLKQS